MSADTNPESDMEKTQKSIDDIQKGLEQQRTMLANLLDNAEKREGHAIALRSIMGHAHGVGGSTTGVPSYTAVHSLRHIANESNLLMGSEMAFLSNYIDDDGNVRVDKANAEKLAQRAPDWTRQPSLTAYLLHDKNHKFGTILAVISPDWIDNPHSNKWNMEGRALESAVTWKALDLQGFIGLIDLRNLDAYALDGQHRIMGVRGLRELKNGRLPYKKKMNVRPAMKSRK